MEIISLLVVLSIIVSFIFLGIATVRLIQAVDQTDQRQKSITHSDLPSNDLTYNKTARSNVSAIRALKFKT